MLSSLCDGCMSGRFGTVCIENTCAALLLDVQTTATASHCKIGTATVAFLPSMPSLCSFLDEQLKPLPPTEPWSITLLGRSGFSCSAAFSLRFRLEQNVRLVRRICGEEVIKKPVGPETAALRSLAGPICRGIGSQACSCNFDLDGLGGAPSFSSLSRMPCPFGGIVNMTMTYHYDDGDDEDCH